ncbi:CxxH/CxxC protein [Bacillus sp. RG28]|uniref:CxxH/CxxC protein n=1 Tax=Gottfriedia endophytica TaxID=2820819 RepID=A0A940SIZ1_9BACI|nr:CxxH/CxxC protein [Gottfriedia endophytica]MBP0724921.1 CxxH/CxxC protein [Gottfriedia endophytica]
MKEIYSCLEHVEFALDDYVDKYNQVPVLNNVEDANKLSTTCEYCQNKAIYIVSNTDSPTKCG